MMIERIGHPLATHNGKAFWPFDPLPEEIDFNVIATSLSRVARFGGHTSGPEPYSVAQHSVLVARLLEEAGHGPFVALWGLLHDSAEAYIGDICRPVSRVLNALTAGAIQRAEDRILECVAAKLALPWPVPEVVWVADAVALITEARDLMAASDPLQTWGFPEDLKPDGRQVIPLPHDEARRQWLDRLHGYAWDAGRRLEV